jgi:V/A-type H+-transporting ATPase subunit E
VSSSKEQVSGLENALLERARNLADEYLASAKRDREHILNDCQARLQQREERERLTAQALSERLYQRRVQAAEMQLQSELDKLRWSLVQSVLNQLKKRFSDAVSAEKDSLKILDAFLREAAGQIESDTLVAQVNAKDYQRLQGNWETFVSSVSTEKRIELSKDTLPCTGGVLLRSEDNRIRIDNTFEGRLERLHDRVQREVIERLFAAAAPTRDLFNG